MINWYGRLEYSGNKMNQLKKTLVIVIAILCLVECDLSTKSLAKNELEGQTAKSYLGGYVNFVYAENEGGMLGLGNKLSDELRFIIFQLFVGAVLCALFFYILLKKDITNLQSFAFVLFLSGGIGNLIDRISNGGKVIDFIVLDFYGLRTGIFNVADIYVTVGVSMLLLLNIFVKSDQSKIQL